MNDSYWKGKRVLVTGGEGFVGRHLRQVLANTNVYAPRSKSDLRDRVTVAALFFINRPDIVFHLAARVGGIGANRAQPADFFYDNALMNSFVVDAAAKRHGTKLVTLGSVCMYPKFAPAPFVEENIWQGYPEESNAPYGAAKRALLVQLQACRQQYDLNGIMLVPTNLYGPGDHFEESKSHVIPALIKKFVEAKARGEPTVTVWGTGKATRDFLYVEDAVEALVLAAEKYDRPEPLNLGSGVECSIAQLAETIKAVIGYEGEVVWDATQPDGQPRRVLDSSAAERALGWQARTALTDGLKKTIEWYREQVKQ